MKLLFLIIFTFSLYSQEKTIQIISVNNEVNEYELNAISDISFDLENSTNIIFTDMMDVTSSFKVTNESSISFQNDRLVFTNIDGSQDFTISNLKSIKFEKSENKNYVPFGELIVDEILLNNLTNPWGLDFIGENEIIFTEHDGRLFIYNIEEKSTTQLSGLPSITRTGQGGLLDVTIHPDFEENRYVYLAYTVSESSRQTTAIGRGKLSGNALVDFEELFRGNPLVSSGAHFGCRIVFDNDNMLFFAIGDRGTPSNAQDSTNHYGSVLRIHDDGTIPNDNPYLDKTAAKKELYTLGNRNIQGMFYISEIDQLWAVEHGPRGGDELNIIKAGANYSWPLATYGINYDGTPITELRSIPGHEDPITYWVPSIAPCGMDLVSYNSENNELDVVIGALAGQHIDRLKIVNNEVVESIKCLQGYARFRDIQLSSDGYIYAVTQSPGRLIRLKTK